MEFLWVVTGLFNKITIMNFQRYSICILISSVFVLTVSKAQYSDFDAIGGNLFYITLPQVAKGSPDTRYPDMRLNEVKFYIFSNTKQVVQIFDLKGGMTLLNSEPDVATVYNAYSSTKLYDNLEIPKKDLLSSFKIKSEFPIVVYCYMNTSAGAEAWTPIPADAWGKNYFAATLGGEFIYNVSGDSETNARYSQVVSLAYPEVIITALEDNTKYTITNPDLYKLKKIGEIFANKSILSTGTLNSGQSLYLRGFIDSTRVVNTLGVTNELELAGLNLTADKPIGVISGNSRSAGGINFRPLTGFAKNFYKNLLVEAIPPTDYHGKTFVFTQPSFLDFDIGYVRVYGTNQDSTRLGNAAGFYKIPKGGVTGIGNSPSAGCMLLPKTDLSNSSYFVTDKPSQAFYNSTSKGITKPDLNTKEYYGYSPFMVDITPEENWTNCSPIFTASDMQSHYLNIVTDSAHKDDIFFKRLGYAQEMNLKCEFKVKGTKFVCGGFALDANIVGMLYCKNGGKFGGYVYGTNLGGESFMPNNNLFKDKQNKHSIMPHPAEHREQNSRCYAYPLATKRIQARDSDSIKIDSTISCSQVRYKVKWVNGNLNTIRSIQIVNSTNTNLKFIYPTSNSGIFTGTTAEFEAYAIDPNKDASGTIVIKDRVGVIKKITYYWKGAEVLNNYFEPKSVSLLSNVKGVRSVTEKIIFVNKTNDNLAVKSLSVSNPNYFIIDNSVTSKLPLTLKPNDTLKIGVYAIPIKIYSDTLNIIFGCSKHIIPLKIDTENPCVYINDLDFGTLRVGQTATLPLMITNRKGGELKFSSSDKTGADVLRWINNNFIVEKKDIIELSKKRLLKNEFTFINVTFVATAVGLFRTQGVLYTNALCIKDTTYWVANVIAPGPSITGYDWGERWLTTKNKCTKNTIKEYPYTMIGVQNTGTATAVVKQISLVGKDAELGNFRIIQTVNEGTVLTVAPQYLSVAFIPDEVREYKCKIQLVTTDLDTVWAELIGVGIENHVSVTGFDFGTEEFLGAGKNNILGHVRVANKGVKPLEITRLTIYEDNLKEFNFEDPTSLPSSYNKLILDTGQFADYPVIFSPKTSGLKNAKVMATGNHPICDDSTNNLIGNTYLNEPVTATSEFAFEELIECGEASAEIIITNPTDKLITINSISQSLDDGVFLIEEVFPISVEANSEYRVKIRFKPQKQGEFYTNLIIIINNSMALNSLISGKSYSVKANLEVEKSFDLAENSEIDFPIKLDSAVAKAKIEELIIKIDYTKENLKLLNGGDLQSIFFRTPFEYWEKTVVDSSSGSYIVKLKAPHGNILEAFGAIMNLRFFAAATSVNRFKIEAQILVAKDNCIKITPAASNGIIKKVCNSSLRNIELSQTKNFLKQNYPNPFNPQTEIEFGVALEGEVSLIIYDSRGRKVITLVDKILKAGDYKISWDANSFGSGIYYCRLSYGYGAKVCTMTLRK